MAYNNYISTFEDLLIKYNTVTIHEREVRVLTIEMYKIAHNLAPTFMRDMMINLDVKHCTRSTCKVTIEENVIECSEKINFRFPKTKTVTYGFNSIRSLGPRILKRKSDYLINRVSQYSKENVKTFQFKDCPCKICKY